MSQVLVNNITNRTGGAIGISSGVVVTGVITATSFVGSGSGLSGIDATALKDSGGSVKVQGNTSGVNVTGVASATQFSGNITGVAATFTGNVSIGGTITYEDVTSIDSVGVITARNGIKVGAGQSVSAVSGIVTYYGDGSGLTGIEPGVVNFVASGTIANGATVVINTDGTVGIITQTGSANPSVGTVETFNTFNTAPSSAYDASSGRVVITWSEWNGSAYSGKAIVGTVDPSNNSITFGGAGTFNNRSTDLKSVSNGNGKVVIVYTDAQSGAGDKGTAVVGTVNGTSISFGSEEIFNTGLTYRFACAYDSTNDKVVVCYQDQNNSSSGRAKVGTISNTSISFGNEEIFSSTNTDWMAAAYDSSNKKVVVAYENSSGGAGSGKAIVGTVSGTSISFGTEVVFNSSTTHTGITYDSAKEKIIIAYGGSAKIGTVSNTTINFGTAVQYYSTATYYNSPVYDSTNGRVVITYRAGVSDHGFASVLSTDSIGTNLTAENYIGIAAEAISNGATGKINVVTGTNTGQTGLTTAQKYFVQPTGTLATSAGNPSVVAGTAISGTKIVVR